MKHIINKFILLFTVFVFVFNIAAKGQNVIALSDPSVTTDTLKSGGLILGINSNGGGVINYLSIPGVGNIFGPQSVKYGRSGQSAMRDGMHGGRYNPTQAGFNETLGTPCTIEKQADKLMLPARPLALWYGDCKWDFTEWENIGADPTCYPDGGNSDVDEIDESNLEGKQNTEVKSEFDFYGKYQDYKGKGGIDISCIRHYFEYRYFRDPGHCINQFRPGLSIFNDLKIHNDISNFAPGGIHAAEPFDMSYYILSWHMRYDVENWDPSYRFIKNADGSWNSQTVVREEAYVKETVKERDMAIVPRLVIMADSDDPDHENALGFYMPESEINRFETIGVDKNTGEIKFKDNRYTSIRIWDQPRRIATMGVTGFKMESNGLLNPTRFDDDWYEAFRYDVLVLMGSPNEIWEAITKIESNSSSWDFNDNEARWISDNEMNISYHDSIMTANISDGSSTIMSPDSLLVDADLQKYVAFRIKNQTATTSFSLTFERYGVNDIFSMEVPVTANDEDWKTYAVKVAGNENWKDMIRRIGFNFNSDAGNVEFEFVSIGADGILDCNGDYQGYAYIDGCGTCVGGNTGNEPCEDCMGVANGGAYLNGCGDCVGGTSQVKLTHEWDFYRMDDWTLNPRITGYSNGGVAYLNVIGGDPYMSFNGNVCLDSREDRYLNVIIKNNTNGNVATIYYQNDITNAWKSFSFTVSQNDQELKSYWFDLEGEDNWVGNIHQVRFDPPGDEGAFEIDYLGILKSSVPVEVQTISSNDLLKLVPNPASHKISLQCNHNTLVEIISLNGSVLFAQSISNEKIEVDVSTWKKGVYLVRSQNNSATNCLKLVVQ